MKKQSSKNVKLVVLFVIAMSVCGFGGFLFGTLTKRLEKNGVAFDEIARRFGMGFLKILPYIVIGLCIMNVVLCIVFYWRAKRKFQSWDGENEEVIEESDRLLSVGMLFSNVAFILNMFFFGAFVTGDRYELFEKIPMMRWLYTGIFIFVLLFNLIFQGISVSLVKKMSPEKKGNILSPHFHKEWNSSLDEAEKMLVCQAAYYAFQITNNACLALWILLFAGEMLFNTGVLPIAVVTIIWLILSCSFQIRGIKLEHKK